MNVCKNRYITVMKTANRAICYVSSIAHNRKLTHTSKCRLCVVSRNKCILFFRCLMRNNNLVNFSLMQSFQRNTSAVIASVVTEISNLEF